MISAFTDATNLDILTQEVSSGTLSGTLYCWPFLNQFSPSPGMDSASFVRADTTTLDDPSDSVALTTGDITVNQAGEYTAVAADDFSTNVADDATFPQYVYGYYLSSDSLGQEPVYAAAFDTPLPLVAAGQIVRFAVQAALGLSIGGTGNVEP